MGEIRLNTQITKQTEAKVKSIGEYLFSNIYPAIAITNVFEKFGNDDETIKALAILESSKMIRLDKSLGNHASLMSFHILDSKGNDIPHEMVDSYFQSDTYGNWFYDRKREYCYEHLDKPLPLWNSCLKCFKEKASWICVAHNQSMVFCLKCRIITLGIKQDITKEMDEQFINELCKAHDKDVLRRRGL
jgi:hypothetical protein